MKSKIIAIAAFSLAFVLIVSSAFYMMKVGNNKQIALNATPTPRGPEVTPVPGDPVVSADLFLNPPLKNRPYMMIHDWLGNMDNNLARTLDQKLDYLLNLGYGGFVTNVAWDDKYLNGDTKQFSALNDVLNNAKNRGLGTWLYDEYGFPSGPENGLTYKDHPEYEAIGVGQVTAKGSGVTTTIIDIPANMKTVISATVYPANLGIVDIAKGQSLPLNITNNKLTAQGIDGDWEIRVYGVYPVFPDGVQLGTDSKKLKYPNLLNKDAVANYIAVSYQQYKNNIPDFSTKIKAFFYDEPSLQTVRFRDDANPQPTYPLIPWEGTLAQKFQAKYGYDLLKDLPSLFGGSSDADKQVRQNFYELVANMLKENWTDQISAWCSANGSVSSGHLLCEESLGQQIPLYGDYMEVLSGEGYPGFDILNLIPENFMGMLQTAKQAESIARNRDIDTVMTEFCPAMDTADTAKFNANEHEYAMGTVGLLYLNGTRQLNEYYNPATTSKDDGKIFNNYVARMDYMLDGAHQSSSIGVYYPTKTAQQYEVPSPTQYIYDAPKEINDIESSVSSLIKQFTNAKLDYNFLIEDFIDSATVKDGYLVVGSNKYSEIVFPSVEVVPLKTMQKLDEFAQSGGQLIFVSTLPSKSNLASENAQVKAIAQKYKDNLISSSPVGNSENIALGAKVTASNTDSNAIYNASYVTDGVNDTSSWSSWAGSTPATIDIDLGKLQTFNTLALYTLKGYELGSFSIQYKDGDTWKDVSKMGVNAKDIVIQPFNAVTAQYIRINALKGSVAQPTIGRIVEVEVYNAEKTNGKSLLDRVRDASNMKLTITEANSADANKLEVGQYMKNNRQLYMIANPTGAPIPFSLVEQDAKSFTIYNPFDGSITTTSKDVTIPGYRALFFEPNF